MITKGDIQDELLGSAGYEKIVNLMVDKFK